MEAGRKVWRDVGHGYFNGHASGGLTNTGLLMEAVAASVFLSTDFRAVRGAYLDDFDTGIVRASADRLREAGVGKRRQPALSARRRVRQLRFLFREVEILDRDRLLPIARDRDNLFDGDTDRGLRRVLGQPGGHHRDVLAGDDVAEAVGLAHRHEADVEINADDA